MRPGGRPASITRRDLLRRTVGAAAGAGSLLTVAAPSATAGDNPQPLGSGRDRVAIIGGGAGGVAAAYFIAARHQVDLFEARTRIGGHCDSRVVDYRGQRVVVDIGAQFFHPDTHPVYVTLLEEIGLFGVGHPAADGTRRAPASLCIFPVGGGAPAFSSTHALSTPQTALAFAKFTGLARHAVLGGLPWETSVQSWISGLEVSPSFKRDVLAPWITALIGSPRADAMRASARSILQTFALAFPDDLSQPATTYNSTIGLQGNLQRLLDRTPASVHLNAPVQGLRRTRTGWWLSTARGHHGPYGSVVLNAPARAGHQLLRRVPGHGESAALLGAYEYFDSRLLIHADPAYVDRDRGNWASYNAEARGRECEGSVWYGALQPRLASGATVDVFKSWASRRRADPEHILFERRFQHPVIDSAAIRAARALRRLQGRDGLYFSGQYTTGFDAQESAVYSAIKVAEMLAPASHTLRSLQRRLRANGLAGVNYDL